MKYETITIESTTDYGLTVVIDGRLFAEGLSRDEALGVVASAIFSEKRPIFVRTYEEWIKWHEHFSKSILAVPVGLITHQPRVYAPRSQV